MEMSLRNQGAGPHKAYCSAVRSCMFLGYNGGRKTRNLSLEVRQLLKLSLRPQLSRGLARHCGPSFGAVPSPQGPIMESSDAPHRSKLDRRLDGCSDALAHMVTQLLEFPTLW